MRIGKKMFQKAAVFLLAGLTAMAAASCAEEKAASKAPGSSAGTILAVDSATHKLTEIAKLDHPDASLGWYADAVVQDVTADLQAKKGYTTAQAADLLYHKGARIESMEIPSVQATMDAVYRQEDLFRDSNGQLLQSGMVMMDYSGHVVALEGGRGNRSDDGGQNRGTVTRYLPATVFTPLSAYAPAIDAGLVNWSSLFADKGFIQAGGGSLWPKNPYDSSGGNRTVAAGLARSSNAIAAQVGMRLTPEKSYQFLTEKLGFASLESGKSTKYSDVPPAMLLGGTVHGATVAEMTAAYAIFGNGGSYYKPCTYTCVRDAKGKVMLENKPAATRAVSTETASILNRMLRQVVTSETGTGRKAQITGCPVAGKTGADSSKQNFWWIGLTPEYVGGVWSGYDNRTEIQTSANPSVEIWRSVLEKVEQGRDASKDFTLSADVVQKHFDEKTGALSDEGSGIGWYRQDS